LIISTGALLRQRLESLLADPKITSRLAELGGTVFANSPADFRKLIADDTERWGNVIRAGNIKLE
jgi:tripartite-type tricarboxylate transporter receptor subunit TctC